MSPLKCIIVISVFLHASYAFPQSDYRNGFIVTNSSDTIYGLINYKGNKANAKECKFKKDKKAETRIYLPTDIRAYRFTESKYYVSRVVDPAQEKVFLEYLINGTVDVYYYRDYNGEHYLIDSGDNQLIELKSGDIEVVKNNQRYTRKDKSYVGVLRATFSKSPSISKKVDDLQVSHKSLIQISKDYHSEVCSNETCIIYEKDLPRPKYSWGPVVKFNYYKVINRGGNFRSNILFLRDVEFNDEMYPSIGLYFRRNIPLLNEHLFFTLETSIGKRSLETAKPHDYNGSAHYFYNIKYSQISLYNEISFRYELTKGKIKPLAQAGIFYDLNLQQSYSNDLTFQYGQSSTVLGSSHKNPFSGQDYGLILGAGCVINVSPRKEILVDIKYAYGVGLYIIDANNFQTRTIALSLKYTF